ncbi:MAG: S46 family peptidase, partial [Ginsengibacter sp.]
MKNVNGLAKKYLNIWKDSLVNNEKKSIWLKPTATITYPRPKGHGNYPGQLDFLRANILKILGIIIVQDIKLSSDVQYICDHLPLKPKQMKKLSIVIILFFTLFKASADEGMWLPMLLGQQVYDDMVKHGLKLTKEQLYSINKPSIKDAIVIFGGGCTGEIVSSQGLIFTNHHCGYGVIAGSSTVEHNYLKDGFYAYSKDQEIKSDLTITFLERIVDVTDEVEQGLKGLNYADRAKKTGDVYKSITDKVL